MTIRLTLAFLGVVLASACGTPPYEDPPAPLDPQPAVAAAPGELEKWIRRSPGGDYPLNAGDVVQISVQGHPQYTVTRKIPAGGRVPLYGITETGPDGQPLPVEVVAAGKLVPELEKELAGWYGKLVSPPYITVSVTSYAPKTIYIAGAVASPSAYPLPDDRRVSLVQALAMAGWFRPGAAADRVRIMRVDPSTGERVFLPPIDVQSIVTDGDTSQDLPLLPGDTITVDSRENRTVFIFGQVSNPGEFPWARGMTLSRLITLAGGLAKFPKTSDIRVLRKTRDGPERVYRVDLEAIYDEERPDLPLEPGDVVRVDERFI